MGFYFQEVRAKRFSSMESLFAHAENEKRDTQRVPIGELVGQGSEFIGDHSFGSSDELLQFNREGLQDFCSLLKIPFSLAEEVERPELMTDLMNDLLHRSEIQPVLNGHEFVVDRPTATVMGIVSKTYVSYSNLDLLSDLKKLLSESLGDEDLKLDFEEGYIVNTGMRVRYVTTREVGIVRGAGGRGADRTVLGFQFTNSMTGKSAVKIDFFLKRLVCANGLVAPVTHTECLVFHSGKKKNLYPRLRQRFLAVGTGIGQVLEMWKQLAAIEFDAEKLARAKFTKDILDIFPSYRARLREAGKGMKFSKRDKKEERRIRRDTAAIESIPRVLGSNGAAAVFNSHWRDNQTMFDFVNLFTERAQKCELRERLAIQEKTGELASQIFQHRRKFEVTNGQNREALHAE